MSEQEVPSPRINELSWGWMAINGVGTGKDFKLWPGGRLVVGDLAHHSSWAAWRRFRGWLGHPTWRAAHFRSGNDLMKLAHDASLDPIITRAAIFYPPFGCAAILLSRLDRWLSRRLMFGGAFLVLVATKPEQYHKADIAC